MLSKPPLMSRKWVETLRPGRGRVLTVSTSERAASEDERAWREPYWLWCTSSRDLAIKDRRDAITLSRILAILRRRTMTIMDAGES